MIIKVWLLAVHIRHTELQVKQCQTINAHQKKKDKVLNAVWLVTAARQSIWETDTDRSGNDSGTQKIQLPPSKSSGSLYQQMFPQRNAGHLQKRLLYWFNK